MKLIRSIALGALVVGLTMSANAQATRTWVSGVGDDANPCSRTAPCKTFAGAISKTAASGEINCLDPGGFGTLTITKSITIDCSATLGGVLASVVTGFLINDVSGTATTDTITLRGLDINGTGGSAGAGSNGAFGIRVINIGPAKLIIDKCNISFFNSRGIELANSSNAMSVFIQDTNIYNIASHAIACVPTGTGSINLVTDNLRAHDNAAFGIDIFTNTKAQLRNSTFTKNASGGILVEAAGDDVNMWNCVSSAGAQGVQASAGTLALGLSTITNNSTNGILLAGGTVLSHNNNAIRGNAGNQAPSGGGNIGTQ